MAVLNDAPEKKEPIFIDPLNFKLGNEARELDVEADAYERSAPIPTGRYDLHITESEKCYELKETNNGEKYISANLEGMVVDCANPDHNGAKVFARVSTYLGKGKKISTMAYVLLKLGYPKEKLAGPLTDEELVTKFHKFLIKADRVAKGCLLDWQGYSNAQSAVIFNKMADFPKGPDGQHMHIVDYKKAGQPSEEIIARLKLKDWGGDGAKTGQGGAKAAAATPKATPVVKKAPAAPTPVAAEDDEEEAAPPPVKKPKATPAPTKSEVDALLDGDDE